MNLLQISRAERATSPVFIVGEARSGTTILYRTLQKHPAFRPRRENLWESKLMNHVERAATFGPREPATLFGYMDKDERCYQAFLDAIAPLRPLLRAGAVAEDRFGPNERLWAASGFPLVVRAYFHFAREARGVTRLLEKTPNHVRHADRLLSCYPRARLIYIYRHPVDVYTSYVRRAEVDPKATKWASISLDAFAHKWRTNSLLALEAARRLPGRFLLLRYEDFTADPEAAGRRICDFVGEPFDPEIVVERKPNLEKRKQAPHLYGQITTTTKNWRDYVNPEEAELLQDRLAPMMKRLAYEPYPARP